MMDHTQMSDLLDSVVEAAEYLCGTMERQETAPAASEVLSLLHQAAAVIARETEDRPCAWACSSVWEKHSGLD